MIDFWNLDDNHRKILAELFINADDKEASREWILDTTSGTYEDVIDLIDENLLIIIGKNDSGDDIFKLSDRAIQMLNSLELEHIESVLNENFYCDECNKYNLYTRFEGITESNICDKCLYELKVKEGMKK